MAELLRTGTANKLKTGAHSGHIGATHDAGYACQKSPTTLKRDLLTRAYPRGLGDLEAVSLVLQVRSRVKFGVKNK